MRRSQIEILFKSGQYIEALKGIESLEPSAWRDTTHLRCLRAMGKGTDATIFANELYETLTNKATVYRINTSQRNNQLRYIALVFAEHGQARQASEIMHSLCDQSPDIPALHREYAFALTNENRLDEAEVELDKAIVLEPTHANTHAQLARIYCRTGRVKDGYNSYSMAASLEPDNPNYLQRLIYWSNYSELTTQQSNFQLTRLWVSKAHPQNQAGTNTWRAANPERKLRLGFVSSDLCAHAVSFFVIPLLEGLDRTHFHVTAYSDTRKPDEVTDAIKKLCDGWHGTARKSDKSLSKLIASDQIDILIDLNGHSSGNRLNVFAKHVAPLQMTWLGYPSTTGLKSISYRITDRIVDPVGENDRFYSERLLRLPSSFICYKPSSSAPDVKPSDNGGVIRFGAFINLAKISSLTMDCWAAAMHAVPNSTLYLKRRQFNTQSARDYFIKEFSERGIAEDRLTLKSSSATDAEHLGEYNNIDIALDTTPYNATTPTLEALWMGVPVISMKGETHASRVSASILEHLNLGGMATNSVNEFAQRAKELTELDESLLELRTTLRNKMRHSPLLNSRQFGRDFGNAMREKWREWCQARDNESSATSAADAVTELHQ